ncbi:MAG: transcription antitermination factor NusB [Rhodospirillaceae bacterium]|nr:transcription antitermination factor NusB [Rhodospirillaceae bacterium]OUT79957.1 MAG: transcription antitermination factor NusB [Rhodospirillaceae bacterium TMED23]|tara:strand:+ start:35 stop:529 length:495 start_codon:yes stop_codon:yes gene_type:complete
MSKKGVANSNSQSSTMARLTAVQSLYEIDMTSTSIKNILQDFSEQRWDNNKILDKLILQKYRLAKPNKTKFTAIITGVMKNQGNIKNILENAVSENIYLDKLDRLLKSILQCGTYEICFDSSTPNKVVINEYINITLAFYERNESSLVNGVLDRIAKIYDMKNK